MLDSSDMQIVQYLDLEKILRSVEGCKLLNPKPLNLAIDLVRQLLITYC
jgi:hypothetical protein